MASPINITSVGGAGVHSVRKVLVNAQDNYLYFKDTGTASTIPAALTDGTGFIYSSGVGEVTGLDDGDLAFIDIISPSQVQLTSESNAGSVLDLTGSVAGSVSLNTPIIYDNRLNIDASTVTNQAVKYYTDGDPLTGLTSGNTYFLKNVSVSDFAGQQFLYQLSADIAVPTGQAEFTTPGTFSWTAPALVTEVSVVCVGGGGGGAQGTSAGSGAGGGGLGWRNKILVTPGVSYAVQVGVGGTRPASTTAGDGGTGGTSFFINPLIVSGNGGVGAVQNQTLTRAGGTFVGDGGGNGGAGGVRVSVDNSGGGGGAGGYTGAGGAGGGTSAPGAGAGGGGGGGGNATAASGTAGSGGGVGLLGAGANGAAGLVNTDGKGGGGGSGGGNGAQFNSGTASVYSNGVFNTPGNYGGGAGASDIAGNEISAGGGGAVRIIWGPSRAFPSTNTGNLQKGYRTWHKHTHFPVAELLVEQGLLLPK